MEKKDEELFVDRLHRNESRVTSDAIRNYLPDALLKALTRKIPSKYIEKLREPLTEAVGEVASDLTRHINEQKSEFYRVAASSDAENPLIPHTR